MKLRKTLLLVLSLVLMVCLSAITVFTATANDKVVFNASDVKSEIEIKESYSINQEIMFPSSITVEYKGSEYQAGNGLIYYPNGACYTLSAHALNQAGNYYLEYFFEADGGVNVTAVINFKVVNSRYSFAKEGGKVTEYATGIGSGITSENHEDDIYTQTIGGLKVDINEGNTFNINVPIDLRNIDNSIHNSSNVAQYSVVGGHYSYPELPEFFQLGVDMYSYGNLDEKGEFVEDATSLVTGFFAGTSSATFTLKEGFVDPGLKFQVYGYNKGKALVGKFQNIEGGYDFDFNCLNNKGSAVDFSLSYASGLIAENEDGSYKKGEDGKDLKPNADIKINYVRIVFEYKDGRNITEQDRATIADAIQTKKTVFNSYAGMSIMRFTDAYDPSIYVEVMIDTSGASYWQRARTNHQEDRGFRGPYGDDLTESTVKRTISFVDENKYLAYRGEYGKVCQSYSQTKSRFGERVSFNIENNRVYSEPISNKGVPVNTAPEKDLLCDFNNDAVYEGNHFQGFTTGEVYVSFYFETYTQTSSQIIIHSIGGYDLEDLLAWDEGEYVDESAPTFETDYESTDGFGSYASVGDTVKIPEVKSWDVNAVGDMAVNVYRNYKSADKVKVNVKNNSFVVNAVDVYTIEYSQKDAYGNVGYYTIDVVGVNDGKGESIILDTEKFTSVKAGSTVQLPEYTVTSLNNLDAFKLKITAKHEKETIEVDTDTMSFVPMYAGTYTLVYECADNLGTYTLEYTFESTSNDSEVVYREVPNLPRYFIKGQKYSIDQAFGYKFNSGAPVAEDADMYAVFDKGDRVKIADPLYTEITGNNEVYFVYKIGEEEFITQTVPIVDVTYYDGGVASGIDMYKYFVGNYTYNDLKADGSGKREANIVYNPIAGENEMNLSFISHINYTNFYFRYRVLSENSNFNRFAVKIVGVQNPKQQVFIELIRTKVAGATEGELVDLVSLYMNGEFHSTLDGYVWGSSSYNTISYTKNTNTINIATTSFILPLEFDGALVDLDVSISDFFDAVDENNNPMTPGIHIANVGNQKLSGTTYKDNTAPSCYIVTSQGDYKIGDEVTFNLPIYSDILSQPDPSTFSFYIVDSDGNNPVSKEGVKLNGKDNAGLGVQYSLAFDKLTTYHVNYTGLDYAGNKVSTVYVINVVDVEPPVIKLTSVEEGKTYKVDKWGTFEFTYEVSDTVSQAANITVSVVLYDVKMGTWRNNVGTSFKCYYAGSFMVQVLAQDEAGNFTSVCFYLDAE